MRVLAACAVVVLLTVGCDATDLSVSAGSTTSAGSTPSDPASSTTAPSLVGKVVVIDPGHQLGNHNFPSEINRMVDAGGFEKACNTTGTATNAGYPEATFAWRTALQVRRLLRDDGVTVLMTRHSNREDRWGPCIDVRGRRGNPGRPGPTADIKLSIHGDGSYADGAHGFHVIAPGAGGRTSAIAAPSLALARTVRDRLVAGGFATSTYRGTDGIDVRSDLGTLNWSERPAVMLEAGNMRAQRDAAWMTSARGRLRLARALVAGLEGYLLRRAT
ncbi:N-acetylmuramoyl-L-alanine amidase family protein [Nocardioides montaniterrae]